jgi:hypothetical protein
MVAMWGTAEFERALNPDMPVANEEVRALAPLLREVIE